MVTVTAMQQIVPTHLIGRMRAFFDEMGLTEAVGGAEALEEGLRQLAAGAMPVVAELFAADAAGVEISEAVFDDDRYPHLVKVHGFLNDILIMDLPPEIRPWAEKLTTFGPPRGTVALRQAAAATAIGRVDALAHLARFALFEALCLNQRLILLAEGAHLESINGRGRDVEAIARQEVDLAIEWGEYGDDLVQTEDPLRALIAAAVVTLRNHVENLNEELFSLRAEVHESLERRRTILEVMDALPADQAVLVYNECAELFGEDKLEAEQLRVHHPAMLGHIGRDAIYQRVHRLPDRIESLKLEPVKRRQRSSLADLILAGATSPTQLEGA